MKKTIEYVAILAFFGVVLVGCKEFTKGYSTDPYGATSAPAPQLFAGSQGAFDMFMEGYPAQMADLWGQGVTGAERQFQGYYIYTTTSQDYINDWPNSYNYVLYNLRIAEKEAAANGQNNVLGAALVLEAMQMGNITALWGDVPYSQAAEPTVTLTPKYDPQLSVYAEVQARLDSGIALLNANSATLPSDIFSSGGNTSLWVKAAYTAKAEFAMQVARYDNYLPADLNNVISWAQQGVINTDGSDDIMFLHTGGVYNGDMNLWYSFGVYDRSGYVDASKSFAIPMMEAYGYGNEMNYYFDTSASPHDLNYGDNGGFGATAEFPIFRASEANLLIAEAYCRMGNTSSALTYLNNAIEYNNNAFGDSTPPYAATDSAVANQATMLQTIWNIEYMSFFPRVELFNFLRRINYHIEYNSGAGVVRLTPTIGTEFPQRFFYPTNEVTANPNTPAQTKSDLFKPTPVNSVADPLAPVYPN